MIPQKSRAPGEDDPGSTNTASATAAEGPSTAVSTEATEHASHAYDAAREGTLAFRNALKLGTSLMLTWGVALIITFKLPKYLGPTLNGFYVYGDQFAAAGAVILTLGVDTYISREIALRPKHASDFFLGLILTRTAALVPLAFLGWLLLSHKLPDEQIAGGLFSIAYLFTVYNQTFQQTLQAASQVGGLAVANVVSKFLWGGGIFFAVTLKAPFWVFPLPLVASEGIKAAFLYYAVRKAVDLRLRFDGKAIKSVLAASFPFYIANVAVTVGGAIDVLTLRELVPEGSKEVGWYGAALKIAGLSALLAPVMSGVLIPMMSRAKQKSEEEFFRILRRGIEAVNVVSIPMALMLALGAEFWIHLTIKDEFLPAVTSLQWLAPTFVFAYANVLLWLSLMILDRKWTIVIVSVAGLAILPPLVRVAVPITSVWGDGGAGAGAAMALSLRELVIMFVFLACLGKRALDRRAVSSTIKSLVICAVVAFAHDRLAGIGHVRLVVDGLLYLVLAVASGVLRPRDAKDVLKMVKDRKKAAAAG